MLHSTRNLKVKHPGWRSLHQRPTVADYTLDKYLLIHWFLPGLVLPRIKLSAQWLQYRAIGCLSFHLQGTRASEVRPVVLWPRIAQDLCSMLDRPPLPGCCV
ncbi:rCG42975 [Rattus norvegicus]|uniref:RCG42975 n=1 Tax=Rattus norvegicus TaxID=10116 RepID=A6IW48_RAT|nr:rCG42975 [Rattus norvegicus]